MPGKKNKQRPSAAGRKVATSMRAIDGSEIKSAAVPAPDSSAAISDAPKPEAAVEPKPAEPSEEAPAASGSSISHTTASEKTGTPRASGTVRKKAAERRISHRFIIIATTLIVVLVVATGVLAWNQWFRYDDAADLQGTWTVQGTDVVITITDTDMVMTSEVSYPYTLDTFAKTIDFSFQDYSGSGSYAFSSDRTTFVITEKDADTGEDVYTTLVKQ